MKGLLLKYGLPLLIISVVITQFYQVYFHNLSRWKGGGFGMYSTFHPTSRQIWAKVNNRMVHINTGNDSLKRLGRAILMLQINPDLVHCKTLAHKLAVVYKSDSIHLSVWEHELDINNNVLSGKLINEVHYAP